MILLPLLVPPAAGDPAAAAPGIPRLRFTDVTADCGLRFRHRAGFTAEKLLPETMGSGLALLDADRDGDLDVYLVQGGSFAGSEGVAGLRDALWQNDGKGTFTDASDRIPDPREAGYGMGAAAGDASGDGIPDVYVTRVGPNRMLFGRGDLSMQDVTNRSGTGDPRWGTSAAFLDADLDGDLDLYVANYVAFDPSRNPWCGLHREGYRSYCHPDAFSGSPDVFYRNAGDGTFEDRSEPAGIARAGPSQGKGLGVVVADFDGDAWPDVFVANDSTANFLWINRGDGTFHDVAPGSGLAFNGEGKTEACMGADARDLDGDARLEVFVTNLDGETHTLYRGDPGGTWRDETSRAGLARGTLPDVGFGCAFLDADLDGAGDLLAVDGHILDNIDLYRSGARYAQEPRIWTGRGDRFGFEDVRKDAGAFFVQARVARGLAVGDLDGDGDEDAIVTVCGGDAVVLRNDSPRRGVPLRVRARTGSPARDALGARITLARGGRDVTREIRATRSYLSSSEPVITFALAEDSGPVVLRILWPGGARETFRGVRPGGTFTAVRGKGEPLRDP